MNAVLPAGPRAPGPVQLMQFARRPFRFLDRMAARYGDAFLLDMWRYGRFVVVSSPEQVRQVFTADPKVLGAGAARADLAPLVGPRSMLLLDGDEHVQHRRWLTPPLHGERMRQHGPLIAARAEECLAEMPRGQPFPVQPFMQRLTMNVILGTVLGAVQRKEAAHLAELLIDYIDPPSPLLMFFAPKIDLPGSPYRAFLRRRRAVDQAIYAWIAQRKQAGTDNAPDVLSLLLDTRDEQGRSLADAELRDELITMLLAGHDTTGTALAWAFECLLSSPACLERLTAEIEASDRTPEAFLRLEYLDAVVKEVLRLRPVFIDVVREVLVPTQLGGWQLPKGIRVAANIYLAHTRPQSWPEPRRFQPERFLGAKVDPYAWFPFGGGSRRCIGYFLALHEMKIVLGTLLARARFALADARPILPARRFVTVAPHDGTRVVLTERR
jgi:cytochrome P450